jgi:hypothetical protein
MSDVEHWTKVILAHVAMSLGERPLRERLGYDGREVKRIGDGESVK